MGVTHALVSLSEIRGSLLDRADPIRTNGVTPEPTPSADTSPLLDRRRFLLVTGTTGLTGLAGCSWVPNPSSGGPAYEPHEIDDGPVFEPGLQEPTERDYAAALVVTESDAELFDFARLSEADAAFVEETDFEVSYLGVIQVSALRSSMRSEVVDIHESDVNLTVNVAVRDDEPRSDDLVITTLLLRVAREGDAPPGNIAVELDIGEHHETFSGSRP